MNKVFKIAIAVIMIVMFACVTFVLATSGQAKSEKHQASTTVVTSPQTIENNGEDDVLVAILDEEPLDAPQEDEQNTLSSQKSTAKKSTSNGSPYYIKVNYQANTVTVYSKDSEGNYTNPCKAMICSTGTATPRSGVYKTSDKYKWGTLIGGVYGHYSTRIVGSILFHSVPYTRNKDNGSIEYWEYDKLGTTASAGCVRLTVADCKWIYDNCPAGTQVEFYASSDPGPLGKPSARKISNAEGDLKNWDPTDPDSDNPWRNQKEEKKEETKKEEKPKTNTNTNTNKNTTTNTNKNNTTNNKPSNTTNKNTITNTTNTNTTINTTINTTDNNTIDNTTDNNNTTNDTNTTLDENQNNTINNDNNDNNNETTDNNEIV